MSLKKLRQQIDVLDHKIVALLNQRTRMSVQIAELKRACGQAGYSPDREQEVLRKIVMASKGPLPRQGLEAIYREIMSSSLSLGAHLKVAYLGPEATFTNLAALKRFGSQVEYIACNTIADVFAVVEKDGVDYGVVPIENSVEGAVSHTMDMFIDSDLKICSQVLLSVSHNLLARCAMSKVKRVYSKAEVFGQCRIWLEKNLPHAEKVDASSTSRAAQIAFSQRYSAAIGSALAAKIYALEVVAKDIQDSAHNITRFLVIGKTSPGPTNADRTSLLFSIKDKVGALHDMLMPFKKYRINLSKIESRPSKKKAWDYYFYVDLEGHRNEPRVAKAVRELESRCRFLKVLGSYPKGE